MNKIELLKEVEKAKRVFVSVQVTDGRAVSAKASKAQVRRLLKVLPDDYEIERVLVDDDFISIGCFVH